jgi:hypothetical protein
MNKEEQLAMLEDLQREDNLLQEEMQELKNKEEQEADGEDGDDGENFKRFNRKNVLDSF